MSEEVTKEKVPPRWMTTVAELVSLLAFALMIMVGAAVVHTDVPAVPPVGYNAAIGLVVLIGAVAGVSQLMLTSRTPAKVGDGK
ncbi:hypothetical protein ACFWPU_00630 [Streptomyces sp. NPDC058471]|uniref:hypothetical protein n=1 Tax=Streptomyces sp. NPDC058471 TaxID=3346516 RepID=UPI003662226E